MAMVRWDPFREFAQLQDRINRVFTDTYGRSSGDEGLMTGGAWVPPVDIYENGAWKGWSSYATGDVFRIAVESGVVKYSKNGNVFYTSANAPVGTDHAVGAARNPSGP